MGTGITILLVFIAVVVTLLIAVPVTRKIAVDNKIKQDAEKIGTAEEKARNIIDCLLYTSRSSPSSKRIRDFFLFRGRTVSYTHLFTATRAATS